MNVLDDRLIYVVPADTRVLKKLSLSQRASLLPNAPLVDVLLSTDQDYRKFFVLPHPTFTKLRSAAKQNAVVRETLNACIETQGVRIEFNFADIKHLAISTKAFMSEHAFCVSCGAKPNLVGIAIPCCIAKATCIGEFYVLGRHYRPAQDVLDFESRRLRDRERYARRTDLVRMAEGNCPKAAIQEIYKLQSGKCYFCDALFESLTTGYQKDHLVPLARGGSHWPSNIALVCAPCNAAKHDRSVTSYWHSIKKLHGSEFVAMKILQHKTNRKAKMSLTTALKRKV